MIQTTGRRAKGREKASVSHGKGSGLLISKIRREQSAIRRRGSSEKKLRILKEGGGNSASEEGLLGEGWGKSARSDDFLESTFKSILVETWDRVGGKCRNQVFWRPKRLSSTKKTLFQVRRGPQREEVKPLREKEKRKCEHRKNGRLARL